MISLNLFKYLFAITVVLSATGCSVYESDGHKAVEKNSGNVVTGFNLKLATRYECLQMVAVPTSWQTDVVSLAEFSTVDTIEAALDNSKDIPAVLVYTTQARTFEGCALEILDSKTSSQRLKDVVEFGENLLLGRE